MNVPVCMQPVMINQVPTEPGCLSILRFVQTGSSVVVSEEAPEEIKGCKWPDVRTWTVLLWENGEAFTAVLKTEMPAPWALESLRAHRTKYPHCWTVVSLSHKPGKN